MNAAFYRQEALEAHAHIAALPKAMRVTRGLVRATTLGIFLSLAGAVAASGFVEIPIEVTGSGLVVDTSGEMLRPANSTASGFVEAAFVRVGDRVRIGQPLLRIHIPELSHDIEKAGRELAQLIDDDRRMSTLEAHDEADELRSRDEKAASLDALIARLERRLAWLREREAAEAELTAKGLSTQAQLLQAKVATQDAVNQSETAKDDRSKLFLQLSEASNHRAHDKLTRQLSIAEKQAEVDNLKQNAEERSIVKSSVDGVVAELATDVGAAVTPGQILVNISPAEAAVSTRRALIYVSLAKGKQIKVDDPVLLLAASLDEKDRDRIKGHVLSVTRTPATRPSMTRQLGSEQLFALLTKDGPVFEVTIELDRDPAGADGLAWASGKGPEAFALTLGTPLSAKVTTERSSLLSLILPALRKLLDPQQNYWSGQPAKAVRT